MLARLDAVPGVAAARSDSSGRFIWIEPVAGSDREVLAASVAQALGPGSRQLPDDEAQAQLASRHRGDPWLRTGEVMTLSFVEGRLLSVRLAGEAARRTGGGAGVKEAIAEAIRVELFAALERVHDEGGRRSSAWIYEEWPAIAAATAARCARTMAPDVAEGLRALLPGLLSR